LSANTNELAVAGAVLIDPACLAALDGLCAPADFVNTRAAAVLSAALALRSAEEPVDPITIQARARADGVALDDDFLRELMELTPTAANVEAYARLVRRDAQARALRSAAAEAEDRLDAGEDPDSVALWLMAEAEDLAAPSDVGAEDGGELLTMFYRERFLTENPPARFVETGYLALDSVLGGGMVCGGLYILAGRPGMGKTTLGLCIAENAAAQGCGVLFVSLEMDKRQIAAKRLARDAGVNYAVVYMGVPAPDDLKEIGRAAAKLSPRRLFVADKPGRTVRDIEVLARRTKGLDLLVVDYLGLIRPESRGKLYEDVTRISGDLKAMARRLKVPVLCLAQLNRANEARSGKRPMLSDLRDSGAIEQDADGVIFIHRPSYYESPDSKKPDIEDAEIIVAKNRHGATGVVPASFQGATGSVDAVYRNPWHKK